MRPRSRLILLSMVGGVALSACSGHRLHVGDDGIGGGHAGVGGAPGGNGGGQAGSAAGAAGTIMPTGSAGSIGGTTGSGRGGAVAGAAGEVGAAGAVGMGGAAGSAGTAGATGQAGGGGAVGNGLSVNPSSATFAGTLVESVSATQTFTVRNDGAATTATVALQGTNAADFRILSNGCGATLQTGASCDVVIAFAPKTRSGARSANLGVTSPSSPNASASLNGTALPSLTLLAGAIGGPGYGDGTGTDARFYSPVGVVSDGAGNLYVADSSTYTIRKIAIATGAVTTIAGAPRQPGTADGIGAAAGFNNLKAIAGDGAGNLYVIDDQGIRKIVIATGTVTTLADDTGTAVSISGATDIACDGTGTLYVTAMNVNSSFLDATIRRVAVSTGTVTTIADRTGVSVHFDGLYGIASDGAGTLYVADANHLEKVVAATGVVSPIATVLGPPSGVAVDGAGNLFVAEDGGGYGGAIRKFVIATGSATAVAGGSGQGGSADGIGAAASFASPRGMAIDGAGNLFVADVYNNTIRKIVIATGAVTTFAGMAGHEMTADGTGTAARFGAPVGVASDGAGNLYVTDRDSYAIRKVVIATGVVSTFVGAGQPGSTDGTGATATFLGQSGITSDGAGNLYLTDGPTVRKVVIATRVVTTIAGAADQTRETVDGTGAAARFKSPWGIASDGAGNLYVADTNGTIRKIVIATRAVTTLAGSPDDVGSVDGVGAAARFNYPGGVATDGAGNLYIGDGGNNTVRKIVIATGAVTTFAGKAGQPGTADGVGAAARFQGPGGLASDGAGNLYVLDGTIRKIAIDSATVTTVLGSPGRSGVLLGGLPASFNAAVGLALLPTGELAIVDNAENAVLMGHL